MGRALDRLRTRTQQRMRRGSMPKVVDRVEDVQINYGISPTEGKVSMAMSKPVTLLAFDREGALGHAQYIVNAVAALDKAQAEANKGKQ